MLIEKITILSKTLTHKILFDGKTAIGVEISQSGKTSQINGGEIILSAGAFNSPQLLQLSGVGDAEHLGSLDIETVHHLPGVGENLQDHLEVYVQQACTQPISMFYALKPWNQVRIGVQWYLFKTGEGASNQFEAGGFIRSNEDVPYPNLQYHFLPIAISYDGTTPQEQHDYQAHVGPMLSDARGHVKIRSKDPTVAPKILFNYLSTEKDKKEWVEAIRKTREIFAQDAFTPYRGKEIAPGSCVESDEEILEFIRNKGESAYHPSCTCKMGSDEMAVTDSELRVHGLNNLRVVDASVMPQIVNGNLNAPTIMIAERAADMILGKSQLEPIKIAFYRHEES